MRSIIAGAIVLLASIGIYFAAVMPHDAHAFPGPASATVLVDIGDGHGSGVHLGGGKVLTANHVVERAEHILVSDDNGYSRTATVLWANPTLDVALVQTNGEGLKQRALECQGAAAGEAITLEGNPFNMGHVTTYGRIALANVHKQGNWQEAVLVDATVAPGMSGGPVFNRAGKIVGIVVGGVPGFPINIIVPAQTICGLLAK